MIASVAKRALILAPVRSGLSSDEEAARDPANTCPNPVCETAALIPVN